MGSKIPLSNSKKLINGMYDKYNPLKYVGDRPILYRSSYELRFMRIVELNPRVIKWSSEQIIIPYVMREKIRSKKTGKLETVIKRHNYHTDFTVWTENGKKYIIEVKPDSLSPKSMTQIRLNPQIYKNACKWKAALLYAKQHGYEFKVVTEKHLKTRIF